MLLLELLIAPPVRAVGPRGRCGRLGHVEPAMLDASSTFGGSRPVEFSDHVRRAFGAFAAAGILAGCSGSPQAIPQNAVQGSAQADASTQLHSTPYGGPLTAHPDRGHSWMAAGAKKRDLLYVSDVGTYDVDVYSYPRGTQVGVLRGFNFPGGECVDKQGDVFVTNTFGQDIYEYRAWRHGTNRHPRGPRLSAHRLRHRYDVGRPCRHKLCHLRQRSGRRRDLQGC